MTALTKASRLLAVLLVSSAPAALASPPRDPLDACLAADSLKAKDPDRETIVASCTEALEAGVADRDQRVRALVQRSSAQWRLDHNAEAEKDAEAALKLAPNDADALLARGVARMAQERVDLALEDFNAVLKAQPHHAVALLYRGRARQWHKNDPAGARADYDAALATDPDFVRGLIQRADLLTNDDPALAERDLKRALTLWPQDVGVRLRLAGFYEARDRAADAMQVYGEASKLDPTDPYAFIYRSALKRLSNDAAGALRDADLAIKADPKTADGYTARAEALAALNRVDEAMGAYRDALRVEPKALTALIGIGFLSRKADKLDEGLQALDAALKIDPKNVEALFDRAMVWGAKGDAKRAIADYDAVIALRPGASAYYNRGQLLARQGEHQAALADFRKAAELDPQDPDALNAMGIELGELKRGAEELAAYDAVLKVDPANMAAKINRAIYHVEHEDWARAVEAYRLALASAPERADLHVRLGDNLLKLDQEAAARKEYDLAIKLAPKSVDGWRARAELNRSSKRLREALADYGQAIAIAPEDAGLLIQRAELLKLDGRDRQAMADFDAAVRLAPKSTYALNNRGLAHSDADRHEAALADFDQAIAVDPDYEPAYYNRANVFISQDRLDRAIRDLNVSLKLSPGDSMTLARKGYVYLLLKDYRRALEELDAAIAADQDYAPALKWRAEVKDALGDTEGASQDRAKLDKAS